MDALLKDLRFGARSLRASPGLVLVSVIALTLGVGLTTAMFSIVYGAMLKGLPFPEGDRIVLIERKDIARNNEGMGVPIHDVVDVKEQQKSFTDVAAYYSGTVNVSGGDRAERYDGAFISANLFRILRVQPLLGRDFRDGEDAVGGERVAVIGYAMWRDRFDSARDVIGSKIRANGLPYTIIGVMPEGFMFPETEAIWLPLGIDPLQVQRGQGMGLNVVARLAPGVSVDQANVDVASIARRLAAQYPKANEGMGLTAQSFIDADLGPEPRQLLYTMLGAVMLVLLIACVNVANLLLDRAAHRTREVGIRSALGAARWQIVRQFLLEALVLSAVAALLGLAVAWFGIRLFNRAIVDAQPPFYVDIRLHPAVLLFTIGLALLTTMVAGVLPALQASRADLNTILKDESRGASSLRIGRLSRALVMFEIALSCGLLVAAGLTIKSVASLRTMDWRFTTAGIFTARVGFPRDYTDTLAQRLFFRELDQRLNALPGARSAALGAALPALSGSGFSFALEGAAYATDRDYPSAGLISITPRYFETYDIAVRAGRGFGSQDRLDTEPVAIVNQTFVDRFLAGQPPLGRRVRMGNSQSTEPWRTIVGVAADVRSVDTEQPWPPTVYVPLEQRHTSFMSIAVGSATGDPLALTAAVREAVAAIDADIPIYNVYSMQQAIARPTWFYRVFGTIFVIFGLVALCLAAIGLYAVMAFSVSRRAREFGIRMALGAQPSNVLRLVVRQGILQIVIGLVFGLALAAGLSQMLSLILYDVQPRDPTIFGGVVLVLGAAGLAACIVPAVRATRTNPLAELRES